jgi:hypothetical protein
MRKVWKWHFSADLVAANGSLLMGVSTTGGPCDAEDSQCLEAAVQRKSVLSLSGRSGCFRLSGCCNRTVFRSASAGAHLDILILLVERPGEVVDKRELLDRVWADVTVDESSLRFHVATLHKALGEGQSGTRYVKNVPGRGYCLAAPVSLIAWGSEPSNIDQGAGQWANLSPHRPLPCLRRQLKTIWRCRPQLSSAEPPRGECRRNADA